MSRQRTDRPSARSNVSAQGRSVSRGRRPSTSKAGLASSFRYAAAGITTAARERNFKIQLCFAVLAVLLGFICQISPVEWAIVLACCGLVLGGEALNTALEELVDMVQPEYDRLAGMVKDCAAGAVLLAALFSFAVGVVIFLPKLLGLMGLM